MRLAESELRVREYVSVKINEKVLQRKGERRIRKALQRPGRRLEGRLTSVVEGFVLSSATCRRRRQEACALPQPSVATEHLVDAPATFVESKCSKISNGKVWGLFQPCGDQSWLRNIGQNLQL